MSFRNMLAISMAAFLAPMMIASTASAQAGAACSGTSCGLGGQIRGQIGDGLPLPISFAPAQGGSGSMEFVGPFTAITIQGTGPSGKGLGQTGQVKPTVAATIMQTTPTAGPRQLTLAPGVFHYGAQPQGSVGVVALNIAVFAVQTNLTYDVPHPGTTKGGLAAITQENSGPIPTGTLANKFFAGGRVGAPIVSFYANATTAGPGSPTNNFGQTGIAVPANGQGGLDDINGLARFTATGNQFGGQSIGRAMGTAKVYFNQLPGGLPGGNLVPSVDLPCKVTATALMGTSANPAIGSAFVPFETGTDCQFALSIVDLTGSDATVGIAGGRFAGIGVGTAFTTPSGYRTGTIGFNGTILGSNGPIAPAVPLTGQGNKGVGFPMTTGMLSVTVDLVVGVTSEMFVRTGTDMRDAAGNGVVALVTGSLTARDISSGNANRTWITLEIPEPSAILAASAGMFALFGCHRLARRRS